MAQYVANTLISEVDRQSARNRILENKRVSTSQRERILSILKKMTAGKLVLEGRSFHLNMDVLQQAEMRNAEKQQALADKQKKNDFAYLDLCSKADEVCWRNRLCGEPDQWKSCRDILAYIKPLKMNGDRPLPTRRRDIIQRYHEWKFRCRRTIDQSTVAEYKRNKSSNNKDPENNIMSEQQKGDENNDDELTKFQM